MFVSSVGCFRVTLLVWLVVMVDLFCGGFNVVSCWFLLRLSWVRWFVGCCNIASWISGCDGFGGCLFWVFLVCLVVCYGAMVSVCGFGFVVGSYYVFSGFGWLGC